jgi:hypothetical protein
MVSAPSEQRTEWLQQGTAEVSKLIGDAFPAHIVVVKDALDETGLLQEPEIVSQNLRLDAVNPTAELKMSKRTIEQLHQDGHDPLPSNDRQNMVDRDPPLCALFRSSRVSILTFCPNLPHRFLRPYHSP